jgi:hypothetical protein
MTKHQGFTRQVYVRLTEAEYEVIAATAVEHGLSASRFLAARAFTDRLLTREEKKDAIALIYQLDRLGNNANQLAHGCNYARLTNTEATFTRSEFERLSREARQAIKAVKEMTRGNS